MGMTHEPKYNTNGFIVTFDETQKKKFSSIIIMVAYFTCGKL